MFSWFFMFCSFVLRSMHLKKQPLLPDVMDWLWLQRSATWLDSGALYLHAPTSLSGSCSLLLPLVSNCTGFFGIRCEVGWTGLSGSALKTYDVGDMFHSSPSLLGERCQCCFLNLADLCWLQGPSFLFSFALVCSRLPNNADSFSTWCEAGRKPALWDAQWKTGRPGMCSIPPTRHTQL